MSPETTAKTAALVAAGTNNILNRTNTLFSHGYGTPSMLHHGDEDVESCLTGWETIFTDQQSCRYADRVSPIREPASQMFHHQENSFADRVLPKIHHMRKDEPSQGWTPFKDEYMNKKTGTLNKKLI